MNTATSTSTSERATAPGAEAADEKLTVAVVDPLMDRRWDEMVESHPLGRLVHLSGWTQVLRADVTRFTPCCLAVIDTRTGRLCAGLPLYRSRSWLRGARLESIPRATLCDPLASSPAEMEALLRSASALADRQGAGAVRIKLYRGCELLASAPTGWNLSRDYRIHSIDLNRDLDEIRRGFHRSCVRQPIDRAVKSGLRLRVAESPADVQAFYECLFRSRKRLGLPTMSNAFTAALWETFQAGNRARVLLAEGDARLLGGLLLFTYKGRMSAEAIGAEDVPRGLSPNHFLFWEAIKLAHRDGCAVFDFGRTSVANESLLVFKRRWGTREDVLSALHYGADAGSHGAREKRLSYRLMRRVFASAPLGLYKLLSHLFYLHGG